MTEEINKIYDPKETIYIDEEFKKEEPEIPCNIWGYIKMLEERIKKLEEVIK